MYSSKHCDSWEGLGTKGKLRQKRGRGRGDRAEVGRGRGDRGEVGRGRGGQRRGVTA